MKAAVKWFKELPFNMEISYSDIPKKYFDWWYYNFEQKNIYSGKSWVKMVESETMDGFLKIKYKDHEKF